MSAERFGDRSDAERGAHPARAAGGAGATARAGAGRDRRDRLRVAGRHAGAAGGGRREGARSRRARRSDTAARAIARRRRRAGRRSSSSPRTWSRSATDGWRRSWSRWRRRGSPASFGRQVPRDASPEEAFLARINYAGRPRRLDGGGHRRVRPGDDPLLERVRHRAAVGVGAVAVSRDRDERGPGVGDGRARGWGTRSCTSRGRRRITAIASRSCARSAATSTAARRSRRWTCARGGWRSGPGHLARELRWVASQHGLAAAAARARLRSGADGRLPGGPRGERAAARSGAAPGRGAAGLAGEQGQDPVPLRLVDARNPEDRDVDGHAE